MTEKKSDFVVSDRRRFTEGGEPAEVTPETSASNGARENSTPEPQARVEAEKFTTDELRESAPKPPTEAEQQQSHTDYKAGSKKLDDMLRERTGLAAETAEMTFERLVASLYMTAMLQLGLMAPEGEQPRIDILGARQTIDTIGLLNEKTKGNLTPGEQNLLQQSLFELRMTFLELTNAIAKAPPPSPPKK